MPRRPHKTDGLGRIAFGKKFHRHQCPECGNIWRHETCRRNEIDPHAHMCPRAGCDGDSDEVLGPRGINLALVASLQEHGLVNPIVLLRHGGRHRYVVMSGKARVRAMRFLGWRSCMARIMGGPHMSFARVRLSNVRVVRTFPPHVEYAMR